ncbi:MAG: ResB-like family no heme-binding motif [Actinobacteria bacterium 66_15]|nr:MAG: ResB-like family no heme-binding motif [Actinobacteria bacterium 66_15]
MRRLLDVLTSRSTSIALMAFVAVCGAIGAYIPQSSPGREATIAAWRARNPLLAGVADALGLHAIFSSWWFLAMLAVFAVVLGIATLRMLAGAWRAWSGEGRVARTAIAGVSADDIAARARAAGYRQRRVAGDARVFARHRVGVWASAILHVGMFVSLIAAAVALGSTRGAILDLSEGEVHSPGDAYWAVEDAQAVPEIGVPIRFDGVTVATWPGGGLREVSATLSTRDGRGSWTPRVVSVNHPLRLNGHTIYAQPGEFGDAAFVVFRTDEGVEHPVRIEFPFIEQAYAVRAAEPLGLRPAGDDSSEPVTLAEGGTGTVAGLTVEYIGTAQWARFIIQREPGMTVLLIGFSIIALGSLMLYGWIPRELVLVETGDGVLYGWHAARMSRAYVAERDAILGLDAGPGEDV